MKVCGAFFGRYEAIRTCTNIVAQLQPQIYTCSSLYYTLQLTKFLSRLEAATHNIPVFFANLSLSDAAASTCRGM